MQVQRCSVSDNTTLTCSEKGDSFSAANRADAANTAAALSTMWLNRSTSPSSCCSGRSNSAIDTSTPNSLCVVDVVQISIVRQGRAVLSLIIAFARRSSGGAAAESSGERPDSTMLNAQSISVL